MKRCDVYQLMSFLGDYLKEEKRTDNLVISAFKINDLSRELWWDGLNCDFSYSAFLEIEDGYPELIRVERSQITINVAYFNSGYEFINYDKDDEIVSLIRKHWEN